MRSSPASQPACIWGRPSGGRCDGQDRAGAADQHPMHHVKKLMLLLKKLMPSPFSRAFSRLT